MLLFTPVSKPEAAHTAAVGGPTKCRPYNTCSFTAADDADFCQCSPTTPEDQMRTAAATTAAGAGGGPAAVPAEGLPCDQVQSEAAAVSNLSHRYHHRISQHSVVIGIRIIIILIVIVIVIITIIVIVILVVVVVVRVVVIVVIILTQ